MLLTVTKPKSAVVVGCKDAEKASPAPDSDTAGRAEIALDPMLRLAVAVPRAVGANVTTMLHVWPAASVVEQPLFRLKAPAPVPVMVGV